MNVSGFLIFTLVLVVVAVLFAFQSVKVVPQQTAWVVERLGKFHAVLTPGLNFIIPFIDRVAYRHSLKEIPLDTPSQVCITRDNTQLTVDGVLFFQVTDPQRASYGTSNYVVAITQLAQTTLRSVVGRMELDKTFEERDLINKSVVSAIDEAALNWGVKVLRYEIKDLTPPAVILQAMQQQITAEREKRAVVAASEGRKLEQINLATGAREAAIAQSEGEDQQGRRPGGRHARPCHGNGRGPSPRCRRHAGRRRHERRQPAGRRKVRRGLLAAREDQQHAHRPGQPRRHLRHDRLGDEDRRRRQGPAPAQGLSRPLKHLPKAPAGFVRGRLFRRTSIITCTACRFILLKRVRGLRSV